MALCSWIVSSCNKQWNRIDEGLELVTIDAPKERPNSYVEKTVTPEIGRAHVCACPRPAGL